MKTYFTFLFSLVAFALLTAFLGKNKEASLVKLWQTDSVLKTPESVYFYADKNILFVANINGESGAKDGNGFISQVSVSGKVESLEWVKGLDAPKGMGVYKKMLYVADLTNVKVIDTEISEIVNTIDVPGSAFLNDISIDANGSVYVSDSQTKKIYKIDDNKVVEWLAQDDFQRLNGLYAAPDALYVVDMGSGTFFSVDYSTKKIIKVAEGLKGGDGIVQAGKGEWLLSNWFGEINYVNNKGEVKKLLDTKEQKINSADIGFSPKDKTIYVPTFFKNSVVAYQLKQ